MCHPFHIQLMMQPTPKQTLRLINSLVDSGILTGPLFREAIHPGHISLITHARYLCKIKRYNDDSRQHEVHAKLLQLQANCLSSC